MKHLKFLIFLQTWLSLLVTNKTSRILAIFPVSGKSHFLFNEAIVRSLYNAGHQITFVSPFPNDESLTNYTVIDSNCTFIYVGNSTMDDAKDARGNLPKLLTKLDENLCYEVLNLKKMQEIYNSKEKLFDVLFVEVMQMSQCFLPLAEKLNIPVIGTVTLRSWKEADLLIGNPRNPAIIPCELGDSSNIMTFYERLLNTWRYIYHEWIHYFVIIPKLNNIYRQYYPTHLLNMQKISMIFVNNHPILLPRPLVPNAIEVSGIHLKPGNPLPQEVQKFIEESEHGVIFVSFGSMIKTSTMNPETIKMFINTFATIPQRVIWKFEDKIDDLPHNVLTMSWLPQRDILAHRNTKAFISHCGMAGTYEAIYEGKPMLLIPLIGDQISNAAILQRLGVGVQLDFYSLTEESLLSALNAIINDTRYQNNMKELSLIFKDRPMTPQETVVYWTEYVIRHNGAPHLRTVAAGMPLYQYLLLDVILFIIVSTIVIFYVIFYVIKKLRVLFSKENRQKLKKR